MVETLSRHSVTCIRKVGWSSRHARRTTGTAGRQVFFIMLVLSTGSMPTAVIEIVPSELCSELLLLLLQQQTSHQLHPVHRCQLTHCMPLGSSTIPVVLEPHPAITAVPSTATPIMHL